MVMNDYRNGTNLPDPASDRLCTFINQTKIIKPQYDPTSNGYLKFTLYFPEFKCNLDASTTPYRYVGLWFNATSGFTGLTEIEVYESKLKYTKND